MTHHHCIRDFQQIRRLVGALRSVHTVNWGASPEGWDYWNERVQKLKDYLGEVPESFRANPSDLAGLLMDGMSWADSNEPATYWGEFHDVLEGGHVRKHETTKPFYQDGVCNITC